MEEQLEKYRQWQKENPAWELICDMPETESLYIQWNELPKAERMHWIGTYRESSKDAFEEFGVKRCKVKTAVLCPDLRLLDPLDWPEGFCMLVFKTDKEALHMSTKKLCHVKNRYK